MNNNLYKTKDLAEVAALIINNKRVLRMEREGKVCWFYFEDKAECIQIGNRFFFGELMVNAREFYETVVRIKTRIFTET